LRRKSLSKENVIKFSGKPGKGLTFEEFDKKTLSWARKQYGNTYAKQLWENNLIDLRSLDLTEVCKTRRYLVLKCKVLDCQVAARK
jgi:hypothetical protein